MSTLARLLQPGSVSRFRRSSSCLAVIPLRGVPSRVGTRDSGVIWRGPGAWRAAPPRIPLGCGICDAAAAGLMALGFQTSEARAAGFIEQIPDVGGRCTGIYAKWLRSRDVREDEHSESRERKRPCLPHAAWLPTG